MDKPRIFLGSSAQQAKLLQALTRGLEDVARVEPWTASFNPGTTTLGRLIELTREVDFAAFIFAGDDWTTKSPHTRSQCTWPSCSARQRCVRGGVVRRRPRNASNFHSPRAWRKTSQRSPRPHLHTIWGDDDRGRDEKHQRETSQGDRDRGPPRRHRRHVVAVFPDGAHRRGAFGDEPVADLARPQRDVGGVRPLMAGGWHAVSAILERSGTGKEGSPRRLLLLERRTAPTSKRACGGWDGGDQTRIRGSRRGLLDHVFGTLPNVGTRTSGVYLRAGLEDLAIMDGHDDQKRAELIAEQLRRWESIRNA